MKLIMPCMQCFFPINGKPPFDFMQTDILDNGLYKLTCSQGHTTITVLQVPKFGILFEVGSEAILDGYSREAVSSFTAALERFYEFYIKVICLKYGINSEESQKTWKLVENQSERQLGAFTYLYLIETKKLPQVLTNKWREFRNNVIHKGYIPKKEEAIEYDDVVLKLIQTIINELLESNRNYIDEIVDEQNMKIHSENDTGYPIASMGLHTIINLVARVDSISGLKTLKDFLLELEVRRSHLRIS